MSPHLNDTRSSPVVQTRLKYCVSALMGPSSRFFRSLYVTPSFPEAGLPEMFCSGFRTSCSVMSE